MAKIIASFVCPKCSFPVDAVVDPVYLFVLYKCPKCNSNVVSYEKKIDVVSDKLLTKLISTGKFKLFSEKTKAVTTKRPIRSTAPCITDEQIKNLRTLMDTEKDFDSFLKKI